MNKIEKDEISQLPYEYRPLTAWSILGWNILFCIFILGFIFTVIFSINRGNINRRSLARFWLLIHIIFLIIVGVTVGILAYTGVLPTLIDNIRAIVGSYLPN